MATSGFVRRTASTSPVASDAVSQTSTPDSWSSRDETLAQEGRVVGDDYAHGNHASTSGAVRWVLAHGQRPAQGGDTVRQSLQSAATRVRAAGPAVGDRRLSSRAVVLRDPDRHLLGLGVLDRVGHRFGDHEPGRALQVRREPAVDDLDVQVERNPAGEVLDGGAKPTAGKRRRLQAGGQVAQLLHREAQAARSPGRPRRGERRRHRSTRADRSCSAIARIRCWAPSCRSRSIRCRSSRCAPASRARDSVTSSTCRANSARSPRLSISAAASWPTASTMPPSVRCGSNSIRARTSAVAHDVHGGPEGRGGLTVRRDPRAGFGREEHPEAGISQRIPEQVLHVGVGQPQTSAHHLYGVEAAAVEAPVDGAARPQVDGPCNRDPGQRGDTGEPARARADRRHAAGDHQHHQAERRDHSTRGECVGDGFADDALDVVQAVLQHGQPGAECQGDDREGHEDARGRVGSGEGRDVRRDHARCHGSRARDQP